MSSAPGTNPGVNRVAHEDSHEIPAADWDDPRGQAPLSRVRAPTQNTSSLGRNIPGADAREVLWTPARNTVFFKRPNIARPLPESFGFLRSMRAKPGPQVHPTGRVPIPSSSTPTQIIPHETGLPSLIPPEEPMRFHRCYRSGCDGLGFPHKAAFEQHLRVHRQADKPHPCPYPGCHRGFDFALEVKEHFKSSFVVWTGSSSHGALQHTLGKPLLATTRDATRSMSRSMSFILTFAIDILVTTRPGDAITCWQKGVCPYDDPPSIMPVYMKSRSVTYEAVVSHSAGSKTMAWFPA